MQANLQELTNMKGKCPIILDKQSNSSHIYAKSPNNVATVKTFQQLHAIKQAWTTDNTTGHQAIACAIVLPLICHHKQYHTPFNFSSAAETTQL
jgi:hypothetical protein